MSEYVTLRLLGCFSMPITESSFSSSFEICSPSLKLLSAIEFAVDGGFGVFEELHIA